jgi:hypothetical protein
VSGRRGPAPGTVPACAKRRYSDEDLTAFLREAGTAAGGRLSGSAYGAFARGRRTADGRPWPTEQTAANRFGSWRAAVQAAGLGAYPSFGGLRRRFSREQCVEAVRLMGERLERTPSRGEYERCARESAGGLPSVATVGVRCAGWSEALRSAGV